MAREPTAAEAERAVQGTVIDNRLQYVMGEVDAVLDRMAAQIHIEVMAEASKGPLQPVFCMAKWYERLAVDRTRATLAKALKNRANVGRR